MNRQPTQRQLEYRAEAPRKRWWWYLMAALVLVPVLIALNQMVIREVNALWKNRERGARMAEYYRVAVEQVPPAGTLVYGQNEDLVLVYSKRGGTSAGASIYGDENHVRFRGWQATDSYRVALRGGSGDFFTIFTGELASPAGEERLVTVDLSMAMGWRREQKEVPMIAAWSVLDDFNWRGEPNSPEVRGEGEIGHWPSLNEEPIRFYFGEKDPEDPSRFIVRYEIGHKEGFIVGDFHDDLTVTLFVRDGPLRDVGN